MPDQPSMQNVSAQHQQYKGLQLGRAEASQARGWQIALDIFANLTCLQMLTRQCNSSSHQWVDPPAQRIFWLRAWQGCNAELLLHPNRQIVRWMEERSSASEGGQPGGGRPAADGQPLKEQSVEAMPRATIAGSRHRSSCKDLAPGDEQWPLDASSSDVEPLKGSDESESEPEDTSSMVPPLMHDSEGVDRATAAGAWALSVSATR
eukprot:CAMPEP_0172912078 /NCGR_PEP_ID=MMETSP1075-20121228/187760_1 /TAXON_ID=2916 /ORGANISM="Ceratium fusus, Strain PA161109" /LENGTH=205 /DNA_ID=CAMNT_0013770495 /DNA_START=352 /DNA_END=967 /DNA_ORIENTATION=+